jgi:hypothetical protein
LPKLHAHISLEVGFRQKIRKEIQRKRRQFTAAFCAMVLPQQSFCRSLELCLLKLKSSEPISVIGGALGS